MTEEEAQKINELYRQIDALTAENTALKSEASVHAHQVKVLEDIAVRLVRVEDKLNTLPSRK
jgi:Tfp pilus assembly protein PilO